MTPERPVVDFVIIGSMKSGTTSLHALLAQHPEISMSAKKETHFFSGKTWHRGVDWYASQFDPVAPVRGEASTSYTKFPIFKDVPERIHAVAPSARLVYLLRDPVDRVVSHLHHNLIGGLEDPSRVDVAVLADDSHYVNVSRYWYQLRRYLDMFEASRTFVLTSEELRSSPHETLHRLCSFLAVDPDHAFVDADARKNVSAQRAKPVQGWIPSLARRLSQAGILPESVGARFALDVPRPTLSPDTKARLVDRLRPDVEAMESFVGRSLSEWRNFA